jgi:RNA polymerase sigma-70 factor (ECF subfamily)
MKGVTSSATPADARLREMLDAHYDFTWRQLRRLGLPPASAEDAAQQVFLVASRRLDDIKPGSERSFLFATARRVASDARRSAATRRETAQSELPERADLSPLADELLDRSRARAQLDRVLDGLSDDLRSVFILFELEGLMTTEIAALLELPMGTVASRLRRAREEFHAIIHRLRARGELPKAEP